MATYDENNELIILRHIIDTYGHLDFDDPLHEFAMLLRSQGLQNEVQIDPKTTTTRGKRPRTLKNEASEAQK